MLETLFPFVGGLGLFLIGMMLLSEGLVAFGGKVLKQSLSRFTGTPGKAVLTGTLVTALVQSSSATTFTLIGFVSAGLIGFNQAIGVLLGASLGNTATGWIVAGLGLKINLGFYTLPLIGIGALMKLIIKGRAASLGMAIAGFGMMFAGLSSMQEGMRGFASVFDLASLPSGGYLANILTLLVGFALTVMLQSSTAAIATTLTALHTQTINFEQASALVVGAAIGTTLNGVLVTIGGTIHARRTAIAYTLFNAAAGAMAIALLPLLFRIITWVDRHLGLDPGAMSLAAFHTLFIGLGIVIVLPLLPRFARLVERLVPDRNGSLTARLDDSLLTIPAVALEAAQRALEQIAQQLLDACAGLLAEHEPPSAGRLQELRRALDTTYAFVSRIEMSPDDAAATSQRIAQLHAIDHLLRFRARLADVERSDLNLQSPGFAEALAYSRQILDLARSGLSEQRLGERLSELESNAADLSTLSRQIRHDLLQRAAMPAGEAADYLSGADACRWLERTGHHIWRISHYLASGRTTGTSDVQVEP